MYQWSPSVAGHPVVNPSGVASLARRGVSTLYIQTSKQSGTALLLDPTVLKKFVSECHRHSIAVVGWYLPALNNLDLDVSRLVAMRDVGVDAIGVDIETTNYAPAERSRRQLQVLERLRQRWSWNGHRWRRLSALAVETVSEHLAQFPLGSGIGALRRPVADELLDLPAIAPLLG